MNPKALIFVATVFAFAGVADQAAADARVNVLAQKIIGGNNAILDRGLDDDPVRATAERSFTDTYQSNNFNGGCGQAICTVQGFAAAAAYADLSKGRIGVSAFAEGVPGLFGEEYRATALGQLTDTVTFTSAGAGQVFIPFAFDIDGDLFGTSNTRRRNGSVTYGMSIFDNVSGTVMNIGGTQPFGSAFFIGNNFVPSPSLVTINRFDETGASGGFFATVGRAYQISLSLSVNDNADYLHTGAFNFALPDGVGFTSASGVFLSSATAAPEPATWALTILGFGSVGFILRRRRAAVVS